MKRRKRTEHTKRPPSKAATLDEVSYVGSSTRRNGDSRHADPAIVLCGDWLNALGFPIGAPIHVFAEAHGRMAIYRPGLRKPRWLRIVAPKSDRSED